MVGRANTLVLCFANSYCLIQEKTKAQLQSMAYIIWYLMINAKIQTPEWTLKFWPVGGGRHPILALGTQRQVEL